MYAYIFKNKVHLQSTCTLMCGDTVHYAQQNGVSDFPHSVLFFFQLLRFLVTFQHCVISAQDSVRRHVFLWAQKLKNYWLIFF